MKCNICEGTVPKRRKSIFWANTRKAISLETELQVSIGFLEAENLKLREKLDALGYVDEKLTDPLEINRELRRACRENKFRVSFEESKNRLRYSFKNVERKYKRIDIKLKFELRFLVKKIDDMVKYLKGQFEANDLKDCRNGFRCKLEYKNGNFLIG